MKSPLAADIRKLYPFRSRYLSIGGLAYHYLDEGAGDPVVMLHGNPTWSFFFRNMVRELAADYRVIVPDHMGCGLSDKPGPDRYDFRLGSRVRDLGRLLDHLGMDRDITLMVHDWGGMIGMVYAVAYPERIKRIILFNTAGFLPPGRKRIPLRLRLVRNFAAFSVPAVLGANLFARAALWMAPRKPLSPDIRKGFIAPYDRPRHRLATLRFVQDIPLAETDPSYGLVHYTDRHLKRLSDTPVLIVWGRHDFVFDLDYLAEWKRRFPDAETHVLEDAGHYLLEDAGDRVSSLVKDFLKKHGLK